MLHTGSGGLAATYRFGATSGLSMVVLGTGMIIAALAFGDALMSIISYFPRSILGVMLFVSGLELCLTAIPNLSTHSSSTAATRSGCGSLGIATGSSVSSQVTSTGCSINAAALRATERRDWTVCLATAGVSVGFHNLGVGFAAGAVCLAVLLLKDRFNRMPAATR